MRNVFVVGLDELNERRMHALPQTAVRILRLLHYAQTHGAHVYRAREMLVRAEAVLAGWRGSIDGITGFWDFPVSTLIPVLCRERKLPSATLESVLRCEHKYWSRIAQRQIFPEHTPSFQRFDPFDDRALDRLALDYPFWIKPVKSFGGYLGFRIDSEDDWWEAMPAVRANIGRLSEPFSYVLSLAHVPREVGESSGSCIAEGVITGRQCTLEGYVYRGEVHVYGVVDSLRFAGRPSFARLQYPSRLPSDVQERMVAVVTDLMVHLEYNDATFNVELYHDASSDTIWILEINTRMAQSHSDLFRFVDGIANHSVLLDVALGRRPEMPHRQGQFQIAAKFFIREFEDGVVSRCPDAAQLAEVTQRFPGTEVQLLVREGDRLSELHYQDSYSYKLGIVYMGARDEAELVDKFARCLDRLDIRFTDERGRERHVRAHPEARVEPRTEPGTDAVA